MNPFFVFLGGVIAVVLLLGSVAFFSTKSEPASLAPKTTETTDIASTSPKEQEPRYTIEAVPYTLKDVMPSLDRAVVFSASVPESARTAISLKITALKKSLTEDPTRADDWYDLALWYHSANDFKGAEEVWKFLTQVVENNPTAYDNLGKLYHFDLKDFPKAEEYFKRSMVADPNSTVPYMELHALYRYSYKKDTTLAVDILEQAAAKFGTDIDSLSLLGAYWRDKGDTAKARAVYVRALERARAVGDVILIQSIGEELVKLPQ